jgi:hypothetical protein
MQVAKLHYRLEVVEASGAPTGLVRPPWHQPMPQGDLRSQVLAFPDDIHWQPTSGNAFNSGVLRKIFPVPEDIFRVCADYYLSNLPPLFGPVVAIEDVGGFYRVHGANYHHTSTLDLEQTRQIITRTCHTHAHIKTTADSLGLTGFPDQVIDVPAVTFMAHRMVSLRLDPQCHPIRQDKLLSLFARGVRASLGRFDLSWSARALFSFWFLAISFSPRPVVNWLAQKFFFPETRGQLKQLVRILHKHP